MNDSSSIIFRIGLFFSRIFRRPYLWAKKKWPASFQESLDPTLNLDTSRMLRDFNFLHRLFFRRGFETIKFDEAELKPLREAFQKGPVVFLLRHWGQVEYNAFNDLFLRMDLPLVVHNNMIKMGHWMPGRIFWPTVRNKFDRFYQDGRWPYNDALFDLNRELENRRPVLFCLNLARGTQWVEESAASQKEIFDGLNRAQKSQPAPIQLVPLHFIYDKHPGRENSLTDILFGERENPGYFRKMILFLRNFKKRAVAKIGEPMDFTAFLSAHEGIPEDRLAPHWTSAMQRAFDTEARQVTGPKLKSRADLIADVLDNPKQRQKVRAFADAHGLTFDAAEKKVRNFLWEIASDIRFTMIELWNYFLGWFLNSLYSGVHVDEEGILKIKRVAKDSALVLTPCHKSHVDYMLLSYVFYHRDLSLPLVCAGNNLNFWPIGPLFRRSGAYFIRRTLEGDDLYPLALKGYVRELLREGYFQEFFIEGTRSRSGKLFPPKTGVLRMIIEAFREEDLKDVYFVPTSISYERVLEESAYLKETKGMKKRKETWTDLFRLPRFLKKRYGKIYVQFGDPISLGSFLDNAPVNPETPDETRLSGDLARQIFASINFATTLLPTGLVALVLLSHLKRSFTYEEIQTRYEELDRLARAGGARLSESLEANSLFALEEVLEQFAKEGLVQAHEDVGERFFTLRDDVRGHLDYFKNTAIHFYAPYALKKLCEEAAGRGGSSATEIWRQADALLVRDFFIPVDWKPAPGTAGAVPDWLPVALKPILESYWLTLKSLTRFPVEKVEQKTLVGKVMEAGETLQLRGLLQYPESLSIFTIQNAVQTFLEMGILKNHEEDLGKPGKKIFSLSDDQEARKNAEELLDALLDR